LRGREEGKSARGKGTRRGRSRVERERERERETNLDDRIRTTRDLSPLSPHSSLEISNLLVEQLLTLSNLDRFLVLGISFGSFLVVSVVVLQRKTQNDSASRDRPT